MKRKVGLLLVFGAAAPLAVASIAWACGVLAVITVDTKVAAPGQTVQLTGKNFARTDAGAASPANPVQIRLQSRTGALLTTVGTSTGRISTPVIIPANTPPGWYTLLATQTTATGAIKTGTPGRTSVRVQGSANSAVAGAPWTSSTPAGPAAQAAEAGGFLGGQSLLAILFAGALSLSMLLGGWTLLNRKSPPARAPQFGI